MAKSKYSSLNYPVVSPVERGDTSRDMSQKGPGEGGRTDSTVVANVNELNEALGRKTITDNR